MLPTYTFLDLGNSRSDFDNILRVAGDFICWHKYFISHLKIDPRVLVSYILILNKQL